jgi:hypothetical protein
MTGLGKERMQVLREEVASRLQFKHLVAELGDSAADWRGFNSVNEICDYLIWALSNKQAGTWIQRLGSRDRLELLINKYKTA